MEPLLAPRAARRRQSARPCYDEETSKQERRGMNATDLSGRCALVTGAARGIGKAIALMLAGAGANVAVNYLQREEDARSVVDAVGRLGRRALAVQTDVSDGT